MLAQAQHSLKVLIFIIHHNCYLKTLRLSCVSVCGVFFSKQTYLPDADLISSRMMNHELTDCNWVTQIWLTQVSARMFDIFVNIFVHVYWSFSSHSRTHLTRHWKIDLQKVRWDRKQSVCSMSCKLGAWCKRSSAVCRHTLLWEFQFANEQQIFYWGIGQPHTLWMEHRQQTWCCSMNAVPAWLCCVLAWSRHTEPTGCTCSDSNLHSMQVCFELRSRLTGPTVLACILQTSFEATLKWNRSSRVKDKEWLVLHGWTSMAQWSSPLLQDYADTHMVDMVSKPFAACMRKQLLWHAYHGFSCRSNWFMCGWMQETSVDMKLSLGHVMDCDFRLKIESGNW